MISLEELSQHEASYQPSSLVQQRLQKVTVLCVVGGVGVGKNYLMRKSGLPIVGRVTSRPPRADDDPAIYRYLSNQELTEKIAQGELVQYGVDLGNQTIYGSLPESYVSDGVTIADIWHWSVSMLKNKGFGAVKAVSVITPWQQWQAQLAERFANREASYRQSRLDEAVHSLRWTRQQLVEGNPDHVVVINTQDSTKQSVKTIVDFAHGRPTPIPPEAIALIDTLLTKLAALPVA